MEKPGILAVSHLVYKDGGIYGAVDMMGEFMYNRFYIIYTVSS